MLGYELTAFWDARPRSAEQYAEDLLQLVRALGATDARLTRWYLAGEQPEPLVTSVEQLRDALLRHPETWEHGAAPFQAYTVRLVNDAPEGGRVSIDAKVGIDRPSGSVWFPNRVGIRFWGPGAQDAFRDVRLVVQWLEIAAVVFEPAWACVCPDGYLKSAWDDLFDGRPVVAWLLYLSRAYGAIAPLPPPSSVYPMRDGHLVVVEREWFAQDNPAHRAAADVVKSALDAQHKRPARVTITPD